MAVTMARGSGVRLQGGAGVRRHSLGTNGSRLWEMGDPSGLPRQGLVALYDPYLDACGLDATARAALQTGVDYSGRGNTLTYGANTNASTDDPSNTGTAWSFDGVDFLGANVAASQVYSQIIVFTTGSTVSTEQWLSNGINGTSFAGLGTASAGYLQIGGKDTGNKFRAIASVAINTTYYACGIQTATSIYGYLGSTKSAATALSGATPSGLLKLGCGGVSATPRFFSGSIHIVAHYSGVELTQSQVVGAYRYLKSIMALRGVTVA